MDALTLLAGLAPLLTVLVFTVLTIGEGVWLLIGRRHPLRILGQCLTIAFYLLATGLLIPLIGIIAMIWGVLLLFGLVATVVALVRSRVASPEERERVRAPLPDGDPSARSAAKRARRTVKRASPPGLLDLGATAALFVAVLVLSLVAG